jgi:hypothetical protein
MNGKAFRVLSDTIYKDKTGSMVREVSCNAVDSHVQAGKADVPFVIHIPSALEPYFSVQDFGLGLSDDSVRQIFTTYFNSTKDNSNDVIGAFGLGSKTPFAYTDTFTVTSVYNGVRIMYAAFLNDDGVPSITEMGREDTADENGVTVSVPVDTKDFQAFRSAVAEQLRFFKVKPKIVNDGSFQFWEPTKDNVLEIDNVILNKSYNGLFVVQGGVGYPLARSHELSGKISDKAYRIVDGFEDVGGKIEVPIGQIEVIASREGISYTARTYKAISDILEKVADRLESEVKDRLATFTTDWEIASFINSAPVFMQLVKASGYRPTNTNYEMSYNGSVSAYLTRMVPNGGFQRFHPDSRSRRDHTVSNINPGDGVIFLMKDETKAYKIRATDYFNDYRTRHNKEPILILCNPRMTATGPCTAADMSNMLGGATVVSMSSLPKPVNTPAARAARTGYVNPDAYCYKPGGSIQTTHGWDRLHDIENETFDDCLIVKVDRTTLMTGQVSQYVYPHAVEAGYRIVGIKAKDWDEFRKNYPDLETLADYETRVAAELNKKYSANRYKMLMRLKQIQTVMAHKFNHRFEKFGAIHRRLPQTSRLRKFLDFHARIQKSIMSLEKKLGYTKITGFDAKVYADVNGFVTSKWQTAVDTKVGEVLREINVRLPFLMSGGYYGGMQISGNEEHTIKYIETFDIDN